MERKHNFVLIPQTELFVVPRSCVLRFFTGGENVWKRNKPVPYSTFSTAYMSGGVKIELCPVLCVSVWMKTYLETVMFGHGCFWNW